MLWKKFQHLSFLPLKIIKSFDKSEIIVFRNELILKIYLIFIFIFREGDLFIYLCKRDCVKCRKNLRNDSCQL